MRPRDFFHRVSYLQYPCMLAALVAMIRPYFTGFSTLLADYNIGLMLLGLATGLSALQDTSKVQNEFSRRVWSNPRKARFFLAMISTSVMFFLVVGAALWLFGSEEGLSQIAVGMMLLGIGMLGFLKAAIEMAEYNLARSDSDPGMSQRTE